VDLYHIWCNLRPDVSDVEFAERIDAYLGHLRDAGKIEGHRISRRKLGLGPERLGEFHVVIEIRDLSQLDDAFRDVSKRSGRVEALHAAVNQSARDLTFALYRDFPDEHRDSGEERF
jgi:Family of unknown function (DUF6614)